MRDLKGKVALVTGASSGIGESIAVALAKAGVTVVLTARDEARLEEVRRKCVAAGSDAWCFPAEVTDEKQVQALADAVHTRYPAIDILINNAGVVMAGMCWEVEPADWHRLHDINVMGVVHGIRAFVPKMIARDAGGHVVNMASVSGLIGARGMSTYSATKFAVVGLSESLRLELHRYRIGVSAVCPGYVKTPIQSKVKMVGVLSRPEAKARVEREFSKASLTAEDVAAGTLRAIRKNEAVVTLGRESPGVLLKRFAPGLLERFLRG